MDTFQEIAFCFNYSAKRLWVLQVNMLKLARTTGPNFSRFVRQDGPVVPNALYTLKSPSQL